MKYSLSLNSNRLFSDKAVDNVLIDTDKFVCKNYIPYIRTKLYEELKSTLNSEQMMKIQYIVEDSKHLFNNMSTENRRFSMYTRNGSFIPPDKLLLGNADVYNQETCRMEDKEIFASIVPLTESLKALLEKPGIYDQMKMHRDKLLNDKEVLSNIVQGSLWRDKYYNPNKDSYPIIIHYDDFEAGNCLGSHSGEQCMCGIYASLPCLPPHLVAELDYILLSTICNTKFVKEFGNEAVFSQTIADLDSLSKNGIVLNTKGIIGKVYFDCILISGDNKGLTVSVVLLKIFRVCTGVEFVTRQRKSVKKWWVKKHINCDIKIDMKEI